MDKNGYSNGNYERHKIFSYVFVITLAIIVLAIEYAIYLAFIPRDIFSFVQQPFTVREDSVFPGQEIHILRESCRIRSTPTTSDMYYQNVSDGSMVYIMTRETYTPTQLGCTSSIITYKIPLDLPAGEWKVIFRMSFRVTPLRIEHRQYESSIFTVHAPTTKAIMSMTSLSPIQFNRGAKMELHITQPDGKTIVIPIETPDE